MKKIVLAAILLSVPAFAQQQSPAEKVLATKMMQELNAALACLVDVATVKDELAKAQARIKDMEAKDAKPKE